jgi:hypothetical protein
MTDIKNGNTSQDFRLHREVIRGIDFLQPESWVKGESGIGLDSQRVALVITIVRKGIAAGRNSSREGFCGNAKWISVNAWPTLSRKWRR